MVEKLGQYFTGIRRKKGQGMTEYIIIVGLIALSAIVIVALFGKQIKAQFSAMTKSMSGKEATVDSTASTKSASEVKVGKLDSYKAPSDE